jgi:hypothetical protein
MLLPRLRDNKIDLTPDSILDPKVEIAGPPDMFETFSMSQQGFDVKLQGKSSEIRVDDEPKIRNWVVILIQSNAVLAVLAFAAWSVDKMISYYAATKST